LKNPRKSPLTGTYEGNPPSLLNARSSWHKIASIVENKSSLPIQRDREIIAGIEKGIALSLGEAILHLLDDGSIRTKSQNLDEVCPGFFAR